MSKTDFAFVDETHCANPFVCLIPYLTDSFGHHSELAGSRSCRLVLSHDLAHGLAGGNIKPCVSLVYR
jgi:hypothetical protein